jgi:hypothetical protein
MFERLQLVERYQRFDFRHHGFNRRRRGQLGRGLDRQRGRVEHFRENDVERRRR